MMTAGSSNLSIGTLAAAGLDVLATEPPVPQEPSLHLPNVLITPHAAFYSRESLRAVQMPPAEAVAAVLAGGHQASAHVGHDLGVTVRTPLMMGMVVST
jgi:phosphoglycerate dehydrogenase-like enzyme